MTPDLIAGRYRVVRAVGRGGMGTVWLCHDEVLGRDVAVKQIGMLPGESATESARALREARSSAALNHRNVVSVFDIVDSDEGHAWLVMEYVPSKTLAEIIRDEAPLPPRRVARICAQIADGLAAAHAAGTIHRDVKPGNILVGEHDVAKISDFGIARGAGDDQLTRTGLVTGTPSYFSPELARGDDPGPESDVYALGATMYAAVEGRPPYPEQRNAIALLQKIASEEPSAATNAGPLAGPIARMMDRDPGSRWSMADAAHSLHRVAEQGDAGNDETAVFAGPVGGATAAGAAATAPEADEAAWAEDDWGRPGPEWAPAAGPTPGPAGQEDREKRRGRMAPWLVAAAVLLLVMLGIGFMALNNGSGDDRQASAAGPESTSPSPSNTTSPSRSAKPTPRETPTPSPSPEATTEGTPTQRPASQNAGQQMEQTVQDYFSVMPEDTDAGWSMLAPSMQAQGRDSYDSWWSKVDSVDLQAAKAVPGQEQVNIELTYRFKDGSAKQETQRLTMQDSDNGYLIADDQVLASRTVS
ncbi:MAG TPA: protein kinase [Nocardioidaceae bacterium]|nr:protein kinase [Nocardioidaceae bacterium]